MALPVLFQPTPEPGTCCDPNCRECRPPSSLLAATVGRRKVLGFFGALGAVWLVGQSDTLPGVRAQAGAAGAAPSAVPARELVTGQPGLPGRVVQHAAPKPYTGPASGCTQPDPTSKGCLTATTAHAYQEISRVFGGIPGPIIRGGAAWDEHAWNPDSDHPRGKAIDLFFSPAGKRATGQAGMRGWTVAAWLRQHADPLHVRYVIWQGRIWTVGRPDDGGWGRAYRGGGVYDPQDATGGHYDHIHVSFID